MRNAVTTRRFATGTASSWGLLVGGLVAYLAMPKRMSTLWNDHMGSSRTTRAPRRTLGGHVAPLVHEYALEGGGGGALKWTVINASSAEFELTLPGQPAWMALAASKNGLMFDSSANSSAVVALWSSSGDTLSATVFKKQLNEKPEKPDSQRVMISSGATLTRTGTFTTLRFRADRGTFGNYEIPGPRGSLHNFIYAYGENGKADGLTYHTTRRGQIMQIDLWATTSPPAPAPAPASTRNSIVLKEGGKLEWQMLSTTKVRFSFYATGSPGWLALGFSDMGNMVGPPSSTAVVGWWKGQNGHISSINLDKKPPTKMPLENDKEMTNATIEKMVDGKFTVLSFVVDSDLDSSPAGAYLVPGPQGTKHNFIYAWGSAGDTSLKYHSSRRGNVIAVDLGKVPTGFDASQEPEIPYFEMHGGLLATIWSVTTLIGGVIARYFRYKSWWIDAHEFLQTVATVLSLPLTILSWLGKGGTDSSSQHYSSVHGMFGIVFASAASVQGTLGSITHMTFAHTNGCFCTRYKLMARARFVHRSLGKTLLLVATAQIILGLQHFEPPDLISGKLGMLTIIFIAYASVVWIGVFSLEVRHQRALCSRHREQDSSNRTKVHQSSGRLKNNNDATAPSILRSRFNFVITTGAGYMTEDDLRRNDATFVRVCKVIDALIKRSSHFESASSAVLQWCQSDSGPGLGLPEKVLKTSRISYPTNHLSMKTSEVLQFSKWLASQIGQSAEDASGSSSIESVDQLKSNVNDMLIENNEIRRGASYFDENDSEDSVAPSVEDEDGNLMVTRRKVEL